MYRPDRGRADQCLGGRCGYLKDCAAIRICASNAGVAKPPASGSSGAGACTNHLAGPAGIFGTSSAERAPALELECRG